MLSFLTAGLAALALQTAPALPAPDNPPLVSLDALPIEQAAAPRCAIAFAVVSKWQNEGDERAAGFPDIEAEGGREFFVQTMAELMDAAALDRDRVSALIFEEVALLERPSGVARIRAMMPACLLMKQSAGL
jgi:hypothetical protein